MSNVNNLGKILDYDQKVKDIKSKYFTTSDYKKFTNQIIDNKIKKELKNQLKNPIFLDLRITLIQIKKKKH